MSDLYTEEMVTRALEHAWGSRPVPPTFTIGRSDMIDALDVVAPLIAAKALRGAADTFRDEYTCDPEKRFENDLECIAWDDAIRFLRVTADELEGAGHA